jgi:pSer/pThr/pTyr-binding forkhead associated (FHA) protein
VLDDDSVSRVHARLELVAMGVVISDIHSTNGLMVNDAEVNAYAPQVTVVHGSVLQVGEVPLRAEFFTS